MKKLVLKISSIEEMQQLAYDITSFAQPSTIIALNGDLGAGKTTFTKGIGKGLGVKKIINSPTFTIVKEYQGRWPLYHFDAYRLEGENEELGFEEMFENDGVCVIEWPMYIQDILPQERLEIHMTKNSDQTRRMTFVPYGEKYQQLLEEMKICYSL